MPDLRPPAGWTLDTLLAGAEDRPLTDRELAGFAALASHGDKAAIEHAIAWVEPQATCNAIIEHHGPRVLGRVLKQIATAASQHRVPMLGRVRSAAAARGLDVY